MMKTEMNMRELVNQVKMGDIAVLNVYQEENDTTAYEVLIEEWAGRFKYSVPGFELIGESYDADSFIEDAGVEDSVHIDIVNELFAMAEDQ